MKKTLLLIAAAAAIALQPAIASESAAPGTDISTKQLSYGSEVEVDHLRYRIYYNYKHTLWNRDGVDIVEIYIPGWSAELIGYTDEFYIPSHLRIPDEITAEGEVIPVVGSTYSSSGSNFNYNDRITEITLGKNMIFLDGFIGCKNLRKINFNTKLETIENLEGCTSLTEVDLPDGLIAIGIRALRNTNLSSITIPKKVVYIGPEAFYGNSSLKELLFDEASAQENEKGLTIDESAFSECPLLTTVTLPAQTDSVATTAFSRALNIKEILVSDKCEKMRSIDGVLYQKTATAYDAVCYPCGKPDTSYTIPEIVSGGKIRTYFKEQWTYYFNEQFVEGAAKNLQHIDFSQLTSPITIEANAIEAKSVNEIYLENVSRLERDALALSTYALVTFGKDVTYIDPLAISNDAKKYVVDAENPLYCATDNGDLCRKLDDGTLRFVRPCNRYTITSCKVAENVTEIGDKAFYFCNEMTEVTFPKSLRSIGKEAFYATLKLKKINFTGSELDWIEPDAFIHNDGINTSNWYISQPNGPVYLGNVLYQWKGGVKEGDRVNVKEGIRTIAPFAMTKFRTHNRYFTGTEWTFDITKITLPSTLKTIGQHAFYQDDKLSQIAIPESVDSIGEYAFAKTGLTSIEIPEQVNRIGRFAFEDCKSLKQITVGSYFSDNETILCWAAFRNGSSVESLQLGGNVTEIDTYAFAYLGSNVAEPLSIEIPASVKRIGSNAFESAKIRSIIIGEGVKSVGSSAFHCAEEVIYDDEWNQIGANHNLNDIHIKATTPPAPETIYDDDNDPYFFSDAVYADVTLFVPVGCVDAYKAAPGWNRFADIREEGSGNVEQITTSTETCSVTTGSGVVEITAPANTAVSIFTPAGVNAYTGHGSATVSLNPGIYVIRVGDHTAKYSVTF